MQKDELEAVLHSEDLEVKDRVLLCLSLDPMEPRKLAEIRSTAIDAGWSKAKKVNFAQYLGKAEGLAVKVPSGWKLTAAGKRHVLSVAKMSSPAPQTQATAKLRKHLNSIKNADVAGFVDESIKCLEYGLLRSAVVLAWVGAVGVLYDHVLKHKLSDFNKAGVGKSGGKWKAITTFDDLADLNEATFIELCESSSVFGKSVKNELSACLKFRNGCGHPNSLAIGDARVVAHIEQLILNVFEKY